MDYWLDLITPADLRSGQLKHVKTARELYLRITLGIPGTTDAPVRAHGAREVGRRVPCPGLVRGAGTNALETGRDSQVVGGGVGA